MYLRHPFAVVLLSVLLAGCASKPSVSSQASVAMTDQPPSQSAYPADAANNPVLSAEEIGRRYLKLFDGLENRDDLTLEYVQKITGLKLVNSDKEIDWIHGYTQPLQDGWVYAFSYITASPPHGKKGVALRFWHLGDQYSNMAPVCALDFEYYQNELKRMGFRIVANYGEIGELLSYTGFKDMANGELLAMTVIPQNLDTRNPEDKVGPLCVKSIGTQNTW